MSIQSHLDTVQAARHRYDNLSGGAKKRKRSARSWCGNTEPKVGDGSRRATAA